MTAKVLSRTARESVMDHLDVLEHARKQVIDAPATLTELIGDLAHGESAALLPPEVRFDAGMAVGFIDVVTEALAITPGALVRLVEEGQRKARETSLP